MVPELSTDEKTELITILRKRFEANMFRHKGMEWSDVLKRLEVNNQKLISLAFMERTGGEPDVTGYNEKSDKFVFMDCSAESPAGRRSLCYDNEALDSRKANKPSGSAMGMAETMGVEILTEEDYRNLQKIQNLDTKTSSWIYTPEKIRNLGGALFCDRRYDTVFVYHNGAESYYAARGFRTKLLV
ncbi:MAG: DUF4256 domain-containing protein [Ignavibacteriaceae bacterium]|nr:DUF4256 domain-containing protein [Ignavibacteriaceae bacterium]